MGTLYVFNFASTRRRRITIGGAGLDPVTDDHRPTPAHPSGWGFSADREAA